MKDITFEATVNLVEDLTFEGKTRSFSIFIDEPEDLGGKDKGPNPVEFLLFALGGCLGITIKAVSKEINIKIDSLKIHLKGDLNPLRFMGKDFSERAGYKKIDVEIEIKSDASKEKLDELIKIVENRCPVSDNITNNTPINIKLR
ncbi:MAG: OsmC family protein [Caldisericia bacterium]